MKRLQNGDTISIVICDWNNFISACLLDNLYKPVIEIKFSRLVIEDDKMTIEGSIGSDLIYTSLTKISNARWLVNEIIY